MKRAWESGFPGSFFVFRPPCSGAMRKKSDPALTDGSKIWYTFVSGFRRDAV